MLTRVKKLIIDVYTADLRVKDLEIKHKQSELLALQSQINPHFLFNTMQSLTISCYNHGDAETASYINKFCSFLRDCLYWETKCIPLSEELRIVENYLALQTLRYEDKFTFLIDVPPCFHQFSIPKFTLQPIVENAVEHGFSCTKKDGFLHIYGQEQHGCFTIVIEDNGTGIPREELYLMKEALKTQNLKENALYIGILNTNERLKLFYGPDFGIALLSEEGKGTSVTISISLTGEGGTDHVSSITGR